MQILSVSEFVRAVSDYLEQGLGMIAVQGEVVDFKVSKGRLVYFELKDDKSRVLCFAIKGSISIDTLEDGQEIKLLGVPKLFKGTGGFHIHVREVILIGEGALDKQFQRLKKKLEKEGLFDEQHKQPLPRFPESIGLITSRDAAAYNDVLVRLNERWGGLTIKHANVSVQGLGSVGQIVRAIEYFNKRSSVDVLAITRGGGSSEDLQSFNDERLVRSVFASKIPVIVGVGHERDVTLAELVADVRASTPTNVAERLVPRKEDVLRGIGRTIEVVYENLISNIDAKRDIEKTFIDCAERWLKRTNDRLIGITRLIESLGPIATLRRGYSITTKNGKVVNRSTELSVGDIIETKFAKGSVKSKIT